LHKEKRKGEWKKRKPSEKVVPHFQSHAKRGGKKKDKRGRESYLKDGLVPSPCKKGVGRRTKRKKKGEWARSDANPNSDGGGRGWEKKKGEKIITQIPRSRSEAGKEGKGKKGRNGCLNSFITLRRMKKGERGGSQMAF